MTICRTCKEDKPEENYWFTSDKKTRHKDCPQCLYKKRKEKQTVEEKEKQKQYRLEWRRNIKARLVKHFGGKCKCCNQEFHQCVMEFHHLDPNEKEAQVNTLGSYDKCLKEAEKCILVCSNCHRLIHAGEVSVGKNMKELVEI